MDENVVWDRICRYAGEPFETKTGLPFSYVARGNYLRVIRDGVEVDLSLSRTNFMKAARLMPTDGPGSIKERQGSAYTWAILMDRRVRGADR